MRLVLEPDLCIMCSSVLLVNKQSGAKAHYKGSQNRCNRWNRARSIPAIFAVVRIVSRCFQNIAGIADIAGVVHSDPNDRNDYMETRLNSCCRILCVLVNNNKAGLLESSQQNIHDILHTANSNFKIHIPSPFCTRAILQEHEP